MEMIAALEELQTITTHDDNLEKQYKESKLMTRPSNNNFACMCGWEDTYNFVLLQLWLKTLGCSWI